jgi:hypothetical protein
MERFPPPVNNTATATATATDTDTDIAGRLLAVCVALLRATQRLIPAVANAQKMKALAPSSHRKISRDAQTSTAFCAAGAELALTVAIAGNRQATMWSSYS